MQDVAEVVPVRNAREVRRDMAQKSAGLLIVICNSSAQTVFEKGF